MNTNDLAARYRLVRDASLALIAPLSAEDCCVQSMPDASPVKWHLAHTTWFFETFVLERWERDFKPFHAAFRVLYNSYYNAVGDKHPRPQRGLLTRPELATFSPIAPTSIAACGQCSPSGRRIRGAGSGGIANPRAAP
jgi:hypothetical protein